MLTIEELESMFREMGLGSEAERKQFIKLATIGLKPELTKKQNLIYITTATTVEKEGKDGELERNPQ